MTIIQCLQLHGKNKVTGEVVDREGFFPQLSISFVFQVTRELPLKSHRGQDCGEFLHTVSMEEAGKLSHSKQPNENMLLTTSICKVTLWNFTEWNLY